MFCDSLSAMGPPCMAFHLENTELCCSLPIRGSPPPPTLHSYISACSVDENYGTLFVTKFPYISFSNKLISYPNKLILYLYKLISYLDKTLISLPNKLITCPTKLIPYPNKLISYPNMLIPYPNKLISYPNMLIPYPNNNAYFVRK